MAPHGFFGAAAAGVAAGVAVIAYISALITGLQANTFNKTLGGQPHVTLQARDDTVTPARLAEPGVTTTRTGAVEADITAMSRALPPNGKLGVAVSIVGPEHRFTHDERMKHDTAITATVDVLQRELRTNREDFTS